MILNIYSLICNCFVSLKAFCDCHFCGITNTINMIFLLLFYEFDDIETLT